MFKFIKKNVTYFRIGVIASFVIGVTLLIIAFTTTGKSYKGKTTVDDETVPYEFVFKDGEVIPYINDVSILGMLSISLDYERKGFDCLVEDKEFGKFVGPYFITVEFEELISAVIEGDDYVLDESKIILLENKENMAMTIIGFSLFALSLIAEGFVCKAVYKKKK